MNNDAHILCVDDEPINLVIYEELLKDQFQLTTVSSGQDCIKTTLQAKPDLILLDVNMPGMNGLETCQHLKDSESTNSVPIIFVSALASDAELMAGYEAGGDDYVTKPFNQNILCKKINVALKNQRAREDLAQRNQKVHAELENRQRDIGNMSTLIDFLHISHSVKSLDLLARYVFEYLAQFSQDCSLLILDSPKNRYWFSDDVDRPMEKQILESLHRQDKIIKFGSRLAINSEYTTLLLRNMPDDESELSEIQDYIGVLIEGLDVRIKTLETSQFLDRREQLIDRVLQKTQSVLGEFSSLERSNKRTLIKAQEKFAIDQQRLLEKLLPADINSQSLTKKTERYNNRILDICNKRMATQQGIEELIDQLKQSLSE